MTKTLIVLESPNKTKTVQKYAGAGVSCVASFGHIRDLPSKDLGVDIARRFSPVYELRAKSDVMSKLRKAILDADQILLATDPDREGEAIAWHIAQAFVRELRGKKVQRVVFHEITAAGVKSGLAAPRAIDQHLVDAQLARRVLDRLVGYKISPLLWKTIKRPWVDGKKPPSLSAGRVQSVALRLVVERDRLIANFVPQEYWTLDVELSPSSRLTERFLARLVQVGKEKPTLTGKGGAQAVVDDLKGAVWQVNQLKQSQEKRNPNPPYTTSSLQQDASRKLRWTPKQTMKVAQELFEGVDLGAEGRHGLITYIRTDAVFVSKEAQEEAREVISRFYGAKALPAEPPAYKTKANVNAQEAHEAIRPTSCKRLPRELAGKLTDDQFKLYTMIYRRFLASQMKPALYDVTTMESWPVGKSKTTYVFRATGRKLVDQGWMVVYAQDTAEEDDDQEKKGEKPLPALRQGEALTCHQFKPEQHFTEPPPPFTEASLIHALEEEGVGRPSTYAQTMETLFDREYIEKVAKRGKKALQLRATEVGGQVNDYLVAEFPDIFSVSFTAEMEGRLDQVAEGALDWPGVVDLTWQRIKDKVPG